MYTCHGQTVYCMLYKWDEYHSSNDMNHKTIQRDMPMTASNKPWERESCYERNEDDIITRRMINMIMGTGSRKKGNRYYWLWWSHRTVPHGTSQNLRKKASCHMHVILWGHFLSYNIHHFHIPGQQGGGTHTLRAHRQLTGLTVEHKDHLAFRPLVLIVESLCTL